MKKTLHLLTAFLVSRLICSFFAYYGHTKRPNVEEVPGAWNGVENWWINPWTTYDSFHYISIATTGYNPETTAFFPLYPFLLKLFGPDINAMALAGTVLSHIFFLISLFLIFNITQKEHSSKIAYITIWVLCFFPAAAFFGAVYTESLFLLLTAITFWAARNNRWKTCALFGAATALTRNPGVLLALALYLEVRNSHASIKEVLKKGYVFTAPLIAFGIVQLYFWATFKSPVAGVVSQEYYGRELMWPWQPILLDAHALLFSCENFVGYFFTFTALFFTVLSLFFIVYAYKKIPTSYIILIAGITFMNLIYARLPMPSTMCSVRYMAALFPFSQLLAIIYYKLHRYPLVVPLLISIQLFMFIVYSYYYGFKIAF